MSVEYIKTDNKRWPYQLTEAFSYDLPESWPKLSENIVTPYVVLTVSNVIVLSRGYAWNGADVAFDTKDIMRASLVHDAFCQLIGWGKLPVEPYRELADQVLYQISREDGMGWIRATYIYYACRLYSKWKYKIKPFFTR